jgi:hypothetical protein
MYIMKEMFNKLKSKLFFKTKSEERLNLTTEELSSFFESAMQTAPNEEIRNLLNKKFKEFKEHDRIAKNK